MRAFLVQKGNERVHVLLQFAFKVAIIWKVRTFLRPVHAFSVVEGILWNWWFIWHLSCDKCVGFPTSQGVSLWSRLCACAIILRGQWPRDPGLGRCVWVLPQRMTKWLRNRPALPSQFVSRLSPSDEEGELVIQCFHAQKCSSRIRYRLWKKEGASCLLLLLWLATPHNPSQTVPPLGMKHSNMRVCGGHSSPNHHIAPCVVYFYASVYVSLYAWATSVIQMCGSRVIMWCLVPL